MERETGKKHDSNSPLWRFPPRRNKKTPPICEKDKCRSALSVRKESGSGRKEELRQEAIKGVWQQAQELRIWFLLFIYRGLWIFASLQFRRYLWFYVSAITSEDRGSRFAFVNRGQYQKCREYNAGLGGLFCAFLQDGETFGIWPPYTGYKLFFSPFLSHFYPMGRGVCNWSASAVLVMVLCCCKPSCRLVTVEIQVEELSPELRLSVKSTSCIGLVSLRVLMQLLFVTATSYTVLGNYIVAWFMKGLAFTPTEASLILL